MVNSVHQAIGTVISAFLCPIEEGLFWRSPLWQHGCFLSSAAAFDKSGFDYPAKGVPSARP